MVNTSQRKVLAVDFLWASECAGGISNTEWDTQNHGTHVAGTVAGDNFANPIIHDPGDGMAPAAKLVIQDAGYAVDNCGDLPGIGCPVVDLNPLFQQAYAQGARLHTNSYGDNENAPGPEQLHRGQPGRRRVHVEPQGLPDLLRRRQLGSRRGQRGQPVDGQERRLGGGDARGTQRRVHGVASAVAARPTTAASSPTSRSRA